MPNHDHRREDVAGVVAVAADAGEEQEAGRRDQQAAGEDGLWRIAIDERDATAEAVIFERLIGM
jgi:hypothetical protein